jgi:hypothetical protein
MRRPKRFSKTVRAMAMARASNQCERCCEAKERLTLHHLNPRDNSLRNAVVLCERCHFWKHHSRKRHHKGW